MTIIRLNGGYMMHDLLDYSKIHEWELYSANIHHDFRQSMDEGKDAARFEKIVAAVGELPAGSLRDELADLLYHAMQETPQRSDYAYDEPSDLQGIRAKRPERRFSFQVPEKSASLRDKIKGAWLGRTCGCLLGLPVECWKAPRIIQYLKATGNYPLAGYLSNKNASDGVWIDKIHGCAPADDDTNYTVLAATRIVGRHGREFSPEHVAAAWLDSLLKNEYCTAERVAYMNLISGIGPPNSAIYKNAFREWIGAQIRGDYYGYINPGNPEAAADMAWRDASISHVKNGIYGGMFVAAMLAAAAACDDITTVIDAGLGQIPQSSRLAEAVGRVLSWYGEGMDAAACFRKIHEQFNENVRYEYIHTISNAMIVTASLLYGEKDYGKSICLAVEVGFDTDCNAATVGSVAGMLIGADHIPASWTEPIGGRLDTAVIGVGRVEIEDMVDMTIGHME